MHFICRTFILICFHWRSWHCPDSFDEILTPLKPKTFPQLNPESKCSPWCLMGPICSTCVHSQIHLHYMCNIYSRSVQPFDHISHAFEPKMPPWGIVGRIVFSLCPFPDESTDVCRIWCQSVNPFGSFPRLKFVTPFTPPPPPKCPCGTEGRIVFSYVHSQTNPQICTNFRANRSSRLTASLDISICDPINPPKCSLWYCGATCI